MDRIARDPFSLISPTPMVIFRLRVGHDLIKIFNYCRLSSQVDTLSTIIHQVQLVLHIPKI